MAKPSRRTFNNFLIIGILFFFMMMHLPDYIRTKLAEGEQSQHVEQVLPEGVIALMPDDVSVLSLKFPTFTLTNGTPWQTDKRLDVSATELANRWLNLSGTEIDTETYNKLKPSLRSLATLVVDRGQHMEPLRLTYYQLPQFWLIQNWENRWLAVSVDQHYLFPFDSQNQ
ncbi:hypothetical protein L4D06_14890 [Enterovibrio makurazakiensis]|uniref:hypothetical protein n=1 Tax=Enterovibrio makurazakiensis TaxID=2910232 RepID=UPI003D2340BC